MLNLEQSTRQILKLIIHYPMSHQGSISGRSLPISLDFEDSTPTELLSATYDTYYRQQDSAYFKVQEYLKKLSDKFLPILYERNLTEDEKHIWNFIRGYFEKHKVQSMFESRLLSHLSNCAWFQNQKEVIQELLHKGYLHKSTTSQGYNIISLSQ